MTRTKMNKGSVLARLGCGGSRARRWPTLPPPNWLATPRGLAPRPEALFCAQRSRLLVAAVAVLRRRRDGVGHWKSAIVTRPTLQSHGLQPKGAGLCGAFLGMASMTDT